jgi:hypothetical protein
VKGVAIDDQMSAADFGGFGGGQRLVALLRDHVVIVMGGMIECQPGSFLGASAAEIENAADLGIDASDGSRALVRAVLASLIRSGDVEMARHGNAQFYRLV